MKPVKNNIVLPVIYVVDLTHSSGAGITFLDYT